MKKGFDPRAFSFLIVLIFSIPVLFVIFGSGGSGDALTRYLLPTGMILLGLYIGFLMFQIPICMKLGWHSRGERLIQAVLPRVEDPRVMTPLLFHLFMFQFQQGRLEEAWNTLDRLTRSDLPSEAKPLLELNRAALYAAEEDAEAALSIYQQYSVEDFEGKQQAVFLNNLAFAYFLLGRELDAGIELADRAFKMVPDPRFSRTLAGLLFRSGSLDAALAWCGYGLKRLPRKERISRAWCWYILALIRNERGEREDAVRAANKGLALSPLSGLTLRLQEVADSE